MRRCTTRSEVRVRIGPGEEYPAASHPRRPATAEKSRSSLLGRLRRIQYAAEAASCGAIPSWPASRRSWIYCVVTVVVVWLSSSDAEAATATAATATAAATMPAVTPPAAAAEAPVAPLPPAPPAPGCWPAAGACASAVPAKNMDANKTARVFLIFPLPFNSAKSDACWTLTL